MLIGVANAELIRGGSQNKKISQYEPSIHALERQLAQARSFAEEEQLAACFPGAGTLGYSFSGSGAIELRKEGQGQGQGQRQEKWEEPVSGTAPISSELLISGVSEVQPDDEDQQSEEAIHKKNRCMPQLSNPFVHRKPLPSRAQVHRIQQ